MMKFEEMKPINKSELVKGQEGERNPNWKGGVCKDLKSYHRKYYLKNKNTSKEKRE